MNRRQFSLYLLCAFGAQCWALPPSHRKPRYAVVPGAIPEKRDPRPLAKGSAWTRLREFACLRHYSLFPPIAAERESALSILEPICREIAAKPEIRTSQIHDSVRASIIHDIKLRRVIVVAEIEISATDRALQVLGVMSDEELTKIPL